MKIQAIFILCVLALAGCNRPINRDAEIEALKQQVATLKAASASSALQKPSDEYVKFLAESRRVTTALSAGISFDDFHARYIEIVSLTQEALPTLNNLETKKLVADFVLSLNDAHTLWEFKIRTDDARLEYNRIPGGFAYSGSKDIGERWSSKLQELNTRYEIGVSPTSPTTSFLPSYVLPKVLTHISNAFLKLDKHNPVSS